MDSKVRFFRARDGAVAGVCKGLAQGLDLDLGFLRLIWIASVLFFGFGFWIYVALAITLPREDRLEEAQKPMLLGVCQRLAVRLELEVGIVRALAIGSAVVSFGTSFLAYLILYFVLPKPDARQNLERQN